MEDTQSARVEEYCSRREEKALFLLKRMAAHAMVRSLRTTICRKLILPRHGVVPVPPQLRKTAPNSRSFSGDLGVLADGVKHLRPLLVAEVDDSEILVLVAPPRPAAPQPPLRLYTIFEDDG